MENDPLAQARRRRAVRAGEAALLLVLGLRLGGGLVTGLEGPRRGELMQAPRPVPLSLATADLGQLEWLPGVGPARARALRAARPPPGSAWTWHDVLAVRGIGPVTVARWQRLAGVTPGMADLSAGAGSRHPGE